jgi:membrane-bound ClpP family serine protease
VTLPTSISTVDDAARHWADQRLSEIENHVDADVVAILSPIAWGLEHHVRMAVEPRAKKRSTLLVLLDTTGGVVEVVERIVRVLRTHYREVRFLVPDRALSAGTILVMSGDAILMDYHSVLGPIDPQVERAGKLVPALSYLHQYEALQAKSVNGTLTTADVLLLQKLDLAELHQFELARELSISLLKEWLARYKFKDWKVTEERGVAVTDAMREERADTIARSLSRHDRWQTHGRGISMQTLRDELKLQIDDYGSDSVLSARVWNYFWFLRDYMNRQNAESVLHSPVYF